MKFRIGGLILSTVALVGLTAPSLADPVKPKPHKVVHVRYKAARYAKPDLFPGSVQSVGSDNRYFSDTAQPPQGGMPPGIMQKYEY